MKSKNTTLS